jgi:hypothetical protein
MSNQLKALARTLIGFWDDHPHWATAALAFVIVFVISLIR